ncbi:hypothetical protein [Psittacicella gerlachiana]|uniref:Porin n=1 Tax=Psittacicella gerlachiana TaxID=2028574 RepID=A0A3A1YN32_9GAMM|nr:hypothetical protein [Psittacicella gerlachiana]RIY38639.1 hypothetical protein CKF59_00515 [Psittacicella gerlachiana]
MLKKTLISLALASSVVATSSAAVNVFSWNDGKSSLSTSGNFRFAFQSVDTTSERGATYNKTSRNTWNMRSRVMFSLKQYVTDNLEAGAFLRLTHTFMSRHDYSLTWNYANRSYGAKTYSSSHAKNAIKPDRFYTYLDSKSLGRLTVALSTGDFITGQGAADVRDFGTSTFYLSNQARAITNAYLKNYQDRLVRYDSPNVAESVPLSFSASYGDMRSNQKVGSETKRRYDTEVSGAVMYQLGSLGRVQFLAAKKQVYANYTTKYATEGYQLGADLRPTGALRVRAEVGTAHEASATAYTSYKDVGVDLSYALGDFTPYGGLLYLNKQIKYKDASTATQATHQYEVYVGTSYSLAKKVANAFNFTLFVEANHVYTDYYKNYSNRNGDHAYGFAGGLIVTW